MVPDDRAEQSLVQTLDIRTEELTADRVVMLMDVTPRLHQPHGIIHGGASVALAESAASVGANMNCADGMVAVGQEINANHLRPKRDGVLRATALPVHIGRTSQVWTVEIRDEDEKLVCISRCTLVVIPAPPGVQRLDAEPVP